MKFPRLKALMDGLPEGTTIAGYIKNAAVYQWSEAEQRYVEVDAPKEHYVRIIPGDTEWRRVQ